MKFSFGKLEQPKGGVAIGFITDDMKPTGLLAKMDKKKTIAKAIKAAAGFKGKKGNCLSLLAPEGMNLDKLIIISLGSKKDLDELALQDLGGKIAGKLNCFEITKASVIVEDMAGKSATEIAVSLAHGAKLRNYRFNRYYVDKKKEKEVSLKEITFLMKDAAKKEFAEMEAVTDGVNFTRDLVSQPPNKLYPETFAKEAATLKKLGVKIKILKEKDMKKLGMGALLGVGQGSIRESHMVIMEWQGAKNKKEQPIAFIGKGVTFDTGGINLKPSAGMGDMKYDMGGAGVVTGLMKALAGRKAKANVIGVIGLVENMPSGSAQRPSDVVTSMSGQTIEVDNTDAEGRLVLADALWYTQGKYKPKFMINLATLTGAIIIALGDGYAGLFSNDDKLADKLYKTGIKTGEKVWRFPVEDHYDKQINSDIADVKNTGQGRGAGSITAAQFLQRFVNKYPWAHIDIAGMTWDKKGGPTCPKGATGFGVKLLNQLVKDHFE